MAKYQNKPFKDLFYLCLCVYIATSVCLMCEFGTHEVQKWYISHGGQIDYQVPWNWCDRIGSVIHPKGVCACVETTAGHWESWCITLPISLRQESGSWCPASPQPSSCFYVTALGFQVHMAISWTLTWVLESTLRSSRLHIFKTQNFYNFFQNLLIFISQSILLCIKGN